tara:strand:+ start:86 stop:838 length:753 start_codon:yes stop_codon:yes gene_type:complete
MKIAIPSYKRPEILINKTLPLLSSYGILQTEIDIFVADDEEYEIYSALVDDINIVVGEVGIDKIRMFMSKYYDEDDEIVYFDDDIEKIEKLVMIDGKKKLQPIDNLRHLIEEGFRLCREKGLRNWGIYPARNGFFMKETVSTDLKYIIGAFTGVINDRACEERITTHGEDYERTIKYYLKFGGVLRFNNITIKTKYFAKGGICASLNDEREKHIDEQLYILEKQYPDLMKLSNKKKYLNPILKDRRKIKK